MLPENVITELNKPLDPRRVRIMPDTSPAKGARYLPSDDVILAANRIFGYGGWSFTLLAAPYLVEEAEPRQQVWGAWGRFAAGDVSHDDFGTCGRSGAGAPALEMAIKGAVSDALKRCLTHMGDQFGLVLRDKSITGHDLEAMYREDQVSENRTSAAGAGYSGPSLGQLLKDHNLKVADLSAVVIGDLSQERALATLDAWYAAEPGRNPQALINAVLAQRQAGVAAAVATEKAFDPGVPLHASNIDQLYEEMDRRDIKPGVVSTYLRGTGYAAAQVNPANIEAWCKAEGRTGKDLAELAWEAQRQMAGARS